MHVYCTHACTCVNLMGIVCLNTDPPSLEDMDLARTKSYQDQQLDANVKSKEIRIFVFHTDVYEYSFTNIRLRIFVYEYSFRDEYSFVYQYSFTKYSFRV